MRRLILALGIAPCWAAVADWQLEPSTCVTEMVGQTCAMRLIARNPQYAQQTLCFWLGEQALGCEQLHDGQIRFDLSFDRDIPFIITQDNQIIYQQTLRINSIAAKKRRRIRLPWSLF